MGDYSCLDSRVSVVLLSDCHGQAVKAMTNDLARDAKTLKDPEAQRKEDDKQRKEAEAERLKIYIDWEIRSHVAQGVS